MPAANDSEGCGEVVATPSFNPASPCAQPCNAAPPFAPTRGESSSRPWSAIAQEDARLRDLRGGRAGTENCSDRDRRSPGDNGHPPQCNQANQRKHSATRPTTKTITRLAGHARPRQWPIGKRTSATCSTGTEELQGAAPPPPSSTSAAISRRSRGPSGLVPAPATEYVASDRRLAHRRGHLWDTASREGLRQASAKPTRRQTAHASPSEKPRSPRWPAQCFFFRSPAEPPCSKWTTRLKDCPTRLHRSTWPHQGHAPVALAGHMEGVLSQVDKLLAFGEGRAARAVGGTSRSFPAWDLRHTWGHGCR